MPDLPPSPTPQERARWIALADPDRLEDLVTEQILEAIRDVLERLGTAGYCAACGRRIYWVHRVNGGRRTPFSARGVEHTQDCCDMAGRPGKLGRWKPEEVNG